MAKQFYVLDLGNGDYKVASTLDKEVKVYPAVVGQIEGYSSFDIGGAANKIENMTLKTGGKEVAIGMMAIKNSNIRSHDITEGKYTSENTMTLVNAAFAMLSNITFSTGNAIIALPVHKMSVAKEIIESFQGKQFGGMIGYFGQYDGKVKNVSLDKVIAMPQPHGTLFNLILDNNGVIMNKDLAKKGVGIYDIGFKTNDGVVFKNLEPIGRLTLHSKNGMYVAYEEIRRKVNNTLNGVELKIFEVPEIVRTGQVKGIKVDHIVNEAFYNLASNIILELRGKWGDTWEVEQTVFTGGGATLLRPYLEQYYFEAIFKDSKSNAEGMLKYANRLWGRENA